MERVDERRSLMSQTHYGRLLVMAVLSFISMYVLMYAMVNRLANVHANLNQFYMAGLMAAAMVIIELALMGAVYLAAVHDSASCRRSTYVSGSIDPRPPR